ncbi:epidermal growth factor receptor substrate 15-like 1 isoform X2 [Drosophila eugracilis]|uniref:epidermal growth factor receptor substrate 15-like 1 isoform X2 n=1 Tax=Drosophila eugracilis TaxID=29029 RepID=UPI001BD9201C|nr:epidermal growth factor receptor substrate 15-like 1 isoform X2 [Drosophila eugracilis]
MNVNVDFAKVCSKHIGVYEAYYKQIDPKATGAIEAMTAAKFLKKSGLSDVVLSRIWDQSDPHGKGFLDKPGFFVALKLVSLSQAGQVANMNNIYLDTANPPKVGELPKTMPSRIQTVPVSSGGVANGDWSIGVIDRLKYEQLFESLSPYNGMLPGNKVKGVLMDSKLPMNILGTIWDLADQDKDGNLDKHEFVVAMHLVYQTLQKRTIPSVLPPELRKPGGAGPPPKPAMPPPPAAAAMPRAPSGEGFGDGGFVANFPKDIGPPAAIPPLPVAVPPMTRIPPVGAVSSQPLIQTDPLIPIGAPPSVTANADWVVTPAELKRFEEIFRQSDLDKDGLVSGLEVKDIFIKSGIPQRSLADIWALCDTNQSGKLTVEQFALAMWFVERKQRGVDPPHVLNANMVPPSMRATVSGVDLQPQEVKPTYSNPELEMISKEIEELARERRVLETEIAQKEADVRVKNGEVRSLQSELDTLTATLKQLENQRGEAQKRLDDLQAQVTKIRDQCHMQEETINEQEGELNAKRSELQKLKDEETSLQKEYDDNNRELSKLTNHLQATQLQISSVRSMVTQLLETQRQMTDALLICRAAMENQNADLVSEYQLKIEPDFDEARKTLTKEVQMPKEDPFEENNSGVANQATNGFASDPFSGQQPSKPAIATGFDDSFNMTSGFDSGFDAFGQSGAGSSFGQTQRDPFGSDAFAANKSSAVTPEPGKDDFGSDPFAALHAPTGQGQVLSPNAQKSGPPPRPESPSPALPPKKSKVPPPRPAPPRAAQPASGFGSGGGGGGGFADFDDFDNKLHNIPSTTTATPQSLPPVTLPPPIPVSSGSSLLDSISLFDDPGQIRSQAVSTPNPTPTTAPTVHSLRPTSSSTPAVSPSVLASVSASPVALVSGTGAGGAPSSSTIITTAPSSNNQQLSRSNTPLQNQSTIAFGLAPKAEPCVFAAFEESASRKAPTPSLITGPTDFKDDPFKDYRYEDPFSIKDPFADDEEEEPSRVKGAGQKKNFAEDFSSEDEMGSAAKTLSNIVNNNNIKAKATTPLNNDLLQQFDAFNLNSSPAPSHHSNTSHHSNSKPNQNQKSQEALDAFADFGDFAAKLATTGGSGTGTTTTTTSNTKLNDSFFDAFNDNFSVNETSSVTTGVVRPNDQKAQAKAFDAFNDNFEDDFKPGHNFAKFEAFEAHNFSSDFGNSSFETTGKDKQNGQVAKKDQNKELAKDKFAADYSKPESFDADLEEALKRSVMDN